VFEAAGELVDSLRRQAEDIVAEPHQIGMKAVSQAFQFGRYLLRRIVPLGVAEQRLRAPVAAIGASAARNQIEGKISMGG
jgi:hypothetical protein